MIQINREPFGWLTDGREAERFVFTNKSGMKAAFTNYGAAVTEIWMPDREGRLEDVVLGYDSAGEYERNDRCAGATCGRVAARLEGGSFWLNGREYHTSRNEDGKHTLHGGFCGFDRKLWEAEVFEEKVRFTYISPDGEEGFPGTLKAEMTVWLTEDGEVHLEYSGISDRDTVMNLTNHVYFQLQGHGKGTVEGHQVCLNADYYAPCDGTPMPDGQILSVEGTPMDFRKPVLLAERIRSEAYQIAVLSGLNHDFFINRRERESLEPCASVWEPETGRRLEVLTTKPVLHFFTANNMTRRRGKDGRIYDQYGGFCVEPGFPANAMRFLHFPSPVLRAGEQYRHCTVFRFTTS